MTKWIIGIVVVVLIGAALWWSGWLPGMMPATQPSTQATTTPQEQTAAAPTNGMSASNDASDQAIGQDSAAIDTQMQGLNQDSADADSSMNDQETAQSY